MTLSEIGLIRQMSFGKVLVRNTISLFLCFRRRPQRAPVGIKSDIDYRKGRWRLCLGFRVCFAVLSC